MSLPTEEHEVILGVDTHLDVHAAVNAVAESFFSSLKKERIKKRIYHNREVATAEISDYINTFYNRTRRHSYLGGVSPEAFEAAAKRRRAVH
jgi:putative transposase